MKKGEVQTETGEMLKGPKPLDVADKKQVVSKGAPGEDRTPDQPIGEIAYALHSDDSKGGAGEPETSKLEPEKQGG